MVNSKQKGARGEREFVQYLKRFGFEARRSQQYCGVGEDASDVICPDLPKIHFEVKRTERLKLYDAIEQAVNDADEGKLPVVAHKRNRGDWLAILPMEDFLDKVLSGQIFKLLNEAGL